MSNKGKHKVLVYGTLRPFTNQNVKKVTGRLYDLGWYPGLILDERGDTIVCEEIEVTDDELDILDSYEGYDSDNPRYSLYTRVKLPTGAFIYQYNREVNEDKRVLSGDWAKHLTNPHSRLSTVLGREFEGA